MRKSSNADQKAWGDAIKVILPTFVDGGGTHVNISGLSLIKHAPNRANAVRFAEFLVSEQGQRLHADLNNEYPVKTGIPIGAAIASFGALKPDPLPIAEIAQHRRRASELVDQVGFDR